MQAGTERPRFRQDLFAESIDEQGARFVDVMDPDSGRVFRFYEVEFSIACAMDGERDVPGLVKWAQDELGVTPTPNEVHTVIATLGELGYLDVAAASRAAATDVPAAAASAPAASGLAASGLAAATAAQDTVVDVPALSATPARTPIPVEDASARRPAAAPGTTSDVSLDLSEHLAVGREDVQEAVRQSRVMAAVEVPPEIADQIARSAAPPPTEVKQPPARPTPVPPARPTPVPAARQTPVERPVRKTPLPAEVKPQEHPIEVKPQEHPIEVKLQEHPVEVKQPERPVEVKPPERPVEVKPPERPVEVKPPERPVQVKQPVVLPNVPEKQPVPEPPPPRRLGPAILTAVLILVVLGLGAFLVWKFVLNDTQPKAGPAVGAAPVAPEPAPPPAPAAPQKQWVQSKIEMSRGRPKTILAFFPGVIEWIETSGKEAQSNDIIMKLQGHKAIEAQVAVMKKEVEKLQADLQAAYKARDALEPADEAARKKAQTKIDALEKTFNDKAEALNKKADQLEPYYVRLIMDGTLTVTRKVGEKIPENTPIATILPPPAPSATFQIPKNLKLDLGTATALKHGEKLLTCETADWEPEKLRVVCPPDVGVTEGAVVSWQLP